MPPENDAQVEAIARGDVMPDITAEAPAAAPVAEPLTPEETKEATGKDVPPVDADAKAEEQTDDAEDDDGQKGHMIPKSRFDQAVHRERERAAQYERELAQYREREQQQNAAMNFEASQAQVKDMLKQHSSLLADGELDKASEVMEAVLQLRDDMQNARMTKQADNARNSAKIEVQYDNTVQRLEAEYPEINPDAEEFDPVAVRRVQMMVTGIMQSEGKNPAEALMEATDILLKPAKAARGESLRDKPSLDAVEAGMRRTQQQIDKNIKAAEQQPPATRDIGGDHDKTGGVLDAGQVSRMSWDEFIKVPDDELARMRGDFIQ